MISQDVIEKVTQVIVDEYQPDKIILFGSYVKDNAGPDSDLDLLVISDKEKEKPRRKRGLSVLYKLRKYHFSKDILFYSKDEVERWKDVIGSFIAEALKEGKVLYGE